MALALALWLSGGAWAHHRGFYVAEDWGKQRPERGVENRVFYLWGLIPSNLSWWAEPDLRPNVVTVVNNWTTAVPKLTWVEAASEASADVAFKSGA